MYDDKVVPMQFSKSIYDFLSKNQSVLFLNNDQFLNIEVFDKQGFLDYNITILNDPKYDYSKTQESKDKLLSMFGDVDLYSILLDRKTSFADIEVDIFGKKTKLRDIYIEDIRTFLRKYDNLLRVIQILNHLYRSIEKLPSNDDINKTYKDALDQFNLLNN